MYQVTFRVNLSHDRNWFQSEADMNAIAGTKTLYLPTGGFGGLPVVRAKHGDLLTLSGMQAVYCKKLVTESKLLELEVYVPDEEPATDSSLVCINNYGLYSVTRGPSSMFIGGESYAFDFDGLALNPDDVDEVALASDGEYTYVMILMENADFRLLKIAPDGSTTIIEVPELAAVYEDRNVIDDGLDDMYDGGNILNTNLGSGVTYTHSPNSSDGEVVDGTAFFGGGSQYFTNNNDGVFTMVATGMSISTFAVDGDLGADGSGEMKSGRFVVTTGGFDYSVFYKCVYEAGDPSVNHLIIINGDHDLTHTVPPGTNEDDDEVSGLEEFDRLAYILFATSGGDNSEATQETLENVATAFITGVGFRTNSASTIKTELNEIGGGLADLIPGRVSFDDGDGAETEGGIPGLSSMTHIGDGKLALVSNQDYIVIATENGEVLVNRSSDGFISFSYIVYFQGQVYGFGHGNSLYYVNKDTGVVQGEGNLEEKKANVLAWDENSVEQPEVESMGFPFVSDDRLFAIAYTDSFNALVEVFPDTNLIKFVCWFEADDLDGIVETPMDADESDEIGFSVSEFIDDTTYFYDGDIYGDENIFYKDPTTENLVVEWADHEEFDGGNGDPAWGAVTITGIVFDEDRQWVISFTEPTEADYVLRMRYSDGSLYNYIYED